MSFSLRRQASLKIGSILEPGVTDRLLALPRPAQNLANVSLHPLISSRTMRMGALAVRSLEKACGLRWKIVFHDDGTLTESDVAFLQRNFDDATILRRPQIEEETLERLKPWPTLAHLRRKFVHSMKVFDPWFHAPFEKYVILDTDVLFFQRPEEILAWAHSDDTACYYNEDQAEVYGIPREAVERAYPFPLWRNVNAGLILFRKSVLSLDLSADFLTRCSAQVTKPNFLDQILYALNMSQHAQGGALPGKYRVHWGGRIPPETVACHLVGDLKWTSFFLRAMQRFPR